MLAIPKEKTIEPFPKQLIFELALYRSFDYSDNEVAHDQIRRCYPRVGNNGLMWFLNNSLRLSLGFLPKAKLWMLPGFASREEAATIVVMQRWAR